MTNEPVTAEQITQLVVFIIDRDEYAVAIDEVHEVVQTPHITNVPGGQDFIIGVTNLRGKIIPVVSLEKVFRLERTIEAPALHVIITEDSAGGLIGIQVDEVIEVIRITSEQLKPAPTIIADKIGNDCTTGIIVIDGSDKTAETQRTILLLKLQKIVSTKLSAEMVEQTTSSVPSQIEGETA